MSRPPDIASALAAKRRQADAVLDHIEPGADLIAGLGNAAPVTVLDAIERGADRLRDVRIHQMVPLRERRYINGEVSGLRHISWFLSPTTARRSRPATATWCKNIVDKVVTEYGVAELRGRSIADRTRRLIEIARPKFRDELERAAREIRHL